jgi:uncharacterized delta-60 repeat protein
MFSFLRSLSTRPRSSARAGRRARQPARPSLELLEQRDLMSAGWLDQTFGTYGRTNPNFNFGQYAGHDARVNAVAVQPDGKVVLAGYATYGNSGDKDFAVMRLNADGTPDASFGSDGKQTIAFDQGGLNRDWASAVAIDAAGNIVVAGTVERGGGSYEFGVTRLRADGAPDGSFGVGGKAVIAFDLGGNYDDEAKSLVIDAQGRIVVAGSASNAGGAHSDFAVARLTADGALDTSFGPGWIWTGAPYMPVVYRPGRTAVEFGQGGWANGVALDSQGRIVLAGTVNVGGATQFDFGIARLTPDGYLDTSFGNHGLAWVDFWAFGNGGITVQTANALAIDAQDRIVVVGQAQGAYLNPAYAVTRLTADGVYDLSFGYLGRKVVQFDLGGNNADQATAVAIDDQGRIVIGGHSALVNAWDFSACRLNDDGSLDGTFGVDGRTWFNFLAGGTNTDVANALAIDAHGRVVIAGSVAQASEFYAVGVFAVARLTGDTPIDFGSVADLTGVGFSLTSLENGSTHPLAIDTQTDNGDGTATITGRWDGKYLTGTVQYDADGNIHILFSWMGGPGGNVPHTFYGTISGDVGAYHIDGMVIVSGGGPGHCVGDQAM